MALWDQTEGPSIMEDSEGSRLFQPCCGNAVRTSITCMYLPEACSLSQCKAAGLRHAHRWAAGITCASPTLQPLWAEGADVVRINCRSLPGRYVVHAQCSVSN